MPHSAAELDTFCDALATRGRHNGHRYLLIWAGDEDWCQQQWCRLSCHTSQRCAVIETGLARGQAVLGQEFDCALIDCRQARRVNDWLAVAGTLVAGGLLHLFAPPLGEWPGEFSASQAPSNHRIPSRFLRRFIELASGGQGVFVLSEQGEIPALPAENHLPWQRSLPSTDQQDAVAAIVRVATGRNKRPLVITADRGRGKTAALGMAAAELQQRQPGATVLLVSSMAASVAVAQRHYAQQTGAFVQGDSGPWLPHSPPDAALEGTEAWDLVMVDEAASLSVGLLERLTERFPRLVFATTISGYEGSGRGFELRFADRLKALRPQARRMSLVQPLRWAADDPLEAFFNRVFVMASTPRPATEVPAVTGGGEISLAWTAIDELMTDEARLSAVFSLLLQAHYQTTPADLQALLDSPLPLLIALRDGNVIGVCECVEEGGLPVAMAQAIIAGRRQPPGNLAAQRLARMAGDIELLSQPSWRVRRIAVAAEARRQGLGQALLAAATKKATDLGQQYVSASFALSDPLIAFWQRAGFAPRYLGSRRDSSSGSYSLVVARPLTALVETPLAVLRNDLANNVIDSLALVQRSLDVPSAIRLLSVLPAAPPSAADQQRLARYLAGELTFEQCASGLRRLLPSAGLGSATGREQRVVLGCLVWAKSWSQLAEAEGLAGRAAVEAEFKAAWRRAV